MTEKIPKSLIAINGEPFVAHQLRLLRSRGITRVIFCVGHLGEMIQQFVGDGAPFGLDVSYSFDGTSLLGTAGAVRKALPILGTSFFVLYGDSYLTCDYRRVAKTFQTARRPGLMTIYRNEGKFDTSNVEADNGSILRYDKRNKTSGMRHIDYGLGVFSSTVFEALPLNEFRDLADVYRNLIASGELAAYEATERFYEIGSAGGIRELEEYLANQAATKSESAV